MQPDGHDALESLLVARERTIAELTTRVARLTAELGDDELLRLLQSMLDARAQARGQAPRSTS
jgi:hypothetical protein